MACALPALLEQAKCLQCNLTGDLYAAAEIVLLCALRDGEALPCTSAELIARANCIRSCIPLGMLGAVRLALLCAIADSIGPPPVTQLFIEQFEATHFDLTGWTEFNGGGGNILDPAYTGVVLEGLQSLRIRNNNFSPDFIRRSITPLGRVFIFFEFELIASGTPEVVTLVAVTNTASVIMASAGVDMNTNNFYVQCGPNVTSLAAVFVPLTKYYCWFEYNKNNGANRFASFGASTSPFRPTAAPDYAEALSVINAFDILQLSFGIVSSDGLDTEEIVMDRIIADSVQIGNNP